MAALAAVLLYRLISYWLPFAAGGVACLLFLLRYRSNRNHGPTS